MQNRYEYQGQYQTPSIVQELILSLLAGTPEIKRGDVKEAVLEFHRSHGGLVNGKSPYTTTALRALERRGLARQLRHGYWRIF